MIRNDGAGVVGGRASLGGEVLVNHQIEDSRRRDLSVVDLDLVGLRSQQSGHGEETECDPYNRTKVHFAQNLLVRSDLMAYGGDLNPTTLAGLRI